MIDGAIARGLFEAAHLAPSPRYVVLVDADRPPRLFRRSGLGSVSTDLSRLAATCRVRRQGEVLVLERGEGAPHVYVVQLDGEVER